MSMKIHLEINKLEQYFIGLFFFISLFSCQKTENSGELTYYEIPKGFDAVQFDSGNEYSNERWLLGKALFYEKRLSKDHSISCGTCHKPEFAFTDPQKTTPGAYNRPGKRNAPTLSNVGYHPYFLKEGGVPTLEMQILVPIQEHNEFANSIIDIVALLSQDKFYDSLSNVAYQRTFDPYVLTRALGVFERTIISGNSAYDDFVNGDSSALTISEMNGMDLFFGKANCSKCHSGKDFTNYEILNNGIFETYPDSGLYRLTNRDSDWGKFKTLTLRNIGLTAPYMHNGEINSLEEIVSIYNQGGMGYKNQSDKIVPLNLSDKEQEDLVTFLKSLTDHSFVNDQKWRE